MKKLLLSLILALPLMLTFTGCSDDDDLPEVNVTFTFQNAVAKNGVIYAVESKPLGISNIVTRAANSDKDAALANVYFYWNYIPAPGITWSPLPIYISLEKMPLVENGANRLGLEATVLEVDKTMSHCYMEVPIVVVDSEEDLPAGAELGTAVYTISIRPYDD